MARLKSSEIAPPFEAPDQTGRTVRLADFAGSMLFIYFFPKANTAG
jgi:thioredoxin-dependent peroxiredoxin